MNYSLLADSSLMWFKIMQSKRMNFFLVPNVLLTTVTLLIDPLLIFCILSSTSLRQETRYILLANTLLADFIFLCFNVVNVICNALDINIHYVVCEVLMVTIVTTCFSSMLSVTLMVTDTFVAMRVPLRYNKILTLSRVKKIIGLLWAVSALYPVVLLVVMEVNKIDTHQSLKVCLVLLALGSLGESIQVGLYFYFAVWAFFCMVLIVYFYIRLYFITKDSGIWSRHSRASKTLLVHVLMFLIYFAPGVVFIVELGLFEKIAGKFQLGGQPVGVWLNTVNLTVLIVLPRACAPFLYGLRYHEIYNTLHGMLQRRHLTQITTS